MADPDAPITRLTGLAITPERGNPNTGLYLPQLTTAERNAIPTSILANGGMIYNTTDSTIEARVDGAWVDIGEGGDVIGPNAVTQYQVAIFSDTSGKNITNSVATFNPAGPGQDILHGALRIEGFEPANNTALTNIGYLQFDNAGTGGILVDSLVGMHLVINEVAVDDSQVSLIMGPGIGTASTSVSALIELQTTTGALLLSRMTTSQRDALFPVNGMIIYNTSLQKFNIYENGGWDTIDNGSGGVISITAGSGLDGGTITSTGTISLSNTTVTPGTYTNINGTIDQQGRITAASNGTNGTVTAITAGTGLTGGTITGTGTIGIATSGVTAGTYTNPSSVTVSATGQLTAIASGVNADVVGPSSSTTDTIATYSGTTGKLLKDSAVSIVNVTFAGPDPIAQIGNVGRINFMPSLPPFINPTIGSVMVNGQYAVQFLSTGGVTSSLFTNGSLGTLTNSSAMVELQSTTGALLLSRMTTTQRDALSAVNGMSIYNSTTSKFNNYEGGGWKDVGTVTAITAGSGLSGGTITSTGTISLSNTTVTPGTYTNINGTIDQQGRITAATNGTTPVAGPGSSTAKNIPTFADTSGHLLQDSGIILRSGSGNLGVGSSTVLSAITSGINNIGVGVDAGSAITSANNNVCLGTGALQSCTTASDNVAIGQSALAVNNGIQNIAIGVLSLTTCSSGYNNVAIGVGPLQYNTIGYYNIAVGVFALRNNIDGIYNIAIGGTAAYSCTSGVFNIAVGGSALYACTSGNNNIAVGQLALSTSTSSSNSVAIGLQALQNSTASALIGIGAGALQACTSGINNTAVGNLALNVSTSAGYNTAFGSSAAQDNSSGTHNTAVGAFALYHNTGGSNNVALGDQAGAAFTSYNNCTMLGAQTNIGSSGLTNVTAIGFSTVPTTSNSVVLGTGCAVGIGKNGPTYALHMGTDNSTTPLIYMASTSAPSAPATANDGIYSVSSGKPTYTSGTSQYSGTLANVNSSGSAATAGTATLNGTTGVTINTTAITSSSKLSIIRSGGAGAPSFTNAGFLGYGSVVANTSFKIYSSNASDTAASVDWVIFTP